MTWPIDPPSPVQYHNLFGKFTSFVPTQDKLYLVMYALGGINIPGVLLKSIRLPQRRWNSDGEVDQTSPLQVGLPDAVVDLLCNETKLSEAIAGPDVVERLQADDTITWSLSPERISSLEEALTRQTIEVLETTALKLICFVTVAETTSVADTRKAFENMQDDSFPQDPCYRSRPAKLLLRKSMPHYLHASVVLFRSILHRVDGELAKSEAHICNFLWRGPRSSTCRDHALVGRLHISHMENKIRCYDTDVPSFAYKWQAQQPLSTLDMEVTFRLQSTASRHFQSIGDFDATRASLEQFLSLGRIKPIPTNSRRVLLGRLFDVYCEMGEYDEAMELLEPELKHITPSDRIRRGFRRLTLAMVEARIGLKQFGAAESTLWELSIDLSPSSDDVNDQQLHIRTLLASARIAHMRMDPGEAMLRWTLALEQVSHMHALGSSHGFIAAVCHLSLAHAQLSICERGEAHRPWTTGLKILACEKCEF
ncbi:uncharacterized protein FFB14_07311 [Fusarium fujikuroi]|nr:uncharacterized protein FFB14_07311 [Fusarium fujikuroi]